LTIGQFAERSGVPYHTLRRLQASGKLMPLVVTDGGHRRYEEWQLDEADKYVRRMKLLPGESAIGSEHLEPFFAYLLGLVLADGTMSDSGQVQIEMKDGAFLREVGRHLSADVHPRKGRPMWQMTVPVAVANRLSEYRVCPRKGKTGFDIPSMSRVSFGHFIRGLFDGDGSVHVVSESRVRLRFHGHSRPMGCLQNTFMTEFGWYFPWVRDKRTAASGQLETGRHSVVSGLGDLMYSAGGVCLARKKDKLIREGG